MLTLSKQQQLGTRGFSPSRKPGGNLKRVDEKCHLRRWAQRFFTQEQTKLHSHVCARQSFGESVYIDGHFFAYRATAQFANAIGTGN
jgi:hypothetical protein